MTVDTLIGCSVIRVFADSFLVRVVIGSLGLSVRQYRLHRIPKFFYSVCLIVIKMSGWHLS